MSPLNISISDRQVRPADSAEQSEAEAFPDESGENIRSCGSILRP